MTEPSRFIPVIFPFRGELSISAFLRDIDTDGQVIRLTIQVVRSAFFLAVSHHLFGLSPAVLQQRAPDFGNLGGPIFLDLVSTFDVPKDLTFDTLTDALMPQIADADFGYFEASRWRATKVTQELLSDESTNSGLFQGFLLD